MNMFHGVVIFSYTFVLHNRTLIPLKSILISTCWAYSSMFEKIEQTNRIQGIVGFLDNIV